jgi:hypothetical protein
MPIGEWKPLLPVIQFDAPIDERLIMRTIYPNGTDLYNALVAEGFELPEECSDVQLEMPIDGIFRLHYSVNVTGDNLAKLGRALTRIGEQHAGNPAVPTGER